MKFLFLVWVALLGANSTAATPGYSHGPPPQAFGLSGTAGETDRLRWQRSFIRQTPTQLLLLVSVVYPGKWAGIYTNFFVNKRGAMSRWVSTNRDTRNNNSRQLNRNTVDGLKHLIPQLSVPVRQSGGTKVVVSFVDEGQWVTCVYSSEALPETLAKIFRTLDFNDYGPAPQHF